MGEKKRSTNYLTVNEAAAYLGVAPKTLSRWAFDGKISCLRTLGGHRRFDRQEILKLVDELTTKLD